MASSSSLCSLLVSARLLSRALVRPVGAPVAVRAMSSAPIKLDPTTHHALSGTPEEHLARRAVIFQHTKNATTQGRQTSKDWAIRFGSAERWENPLMGWVSTADPMKVLRMRFGSAEEAAAFCESQGFAYEVVDSTQYQPTQTDKNYGDNFKYITENKLDPF